MLVDDPYDIDIKLDENSVNRTEQVANIYLKAMGGDFDGDTTYLKSVFSKEANAEAEKLVYAKTNILGANGIASRGLSKIGREAGVTLYALTKD